jgi:hypothetical protein
MGSSSYIRLNNKFVIKKNGKYIQTDITDPDEWSEMTEKQKNRCKGKDVTKKIKELLKKYSSRSNMNFKTGSTKKKIRTKRRSKKKKVKGGG